MRVVIDLQAAQNDSSFRGVGRYCKSLAKAMVHIGADRHEFWLVLNGIFPNSIESLTAEFEGLIPSDRIAIFPGTREIMETVADNVSRLRQAEIMRERFIAALKPDVVHVSSLFEGSVDDAVVSIGRVETMPTAVTLYDLIPLVLPDLYMIGSTFEDYYHSKLASLKKADALLAISEHSRKEAINLFKFSPDHITNISAAIDPMFRQIHYRAEESKAILSKYDIGKPFVLYVPGGFDPRKNFSNLMDAYAKLPASIRETHQLVIGSNVQPMMREELTKKAASFGLSHSELILTGYVPDDELIALYNLCELHVFPSLYEGFGLPALEAMACGAPSIGSNSSSLPEVIGRPDALFDPLSVDSIHRKLFTALTEPDFRGSLRAHALMHAKKFSWERSAALALEKLEYEFAHS